MADSSRLTSVYSLLRSLAAILAGGIAFGCLAWLSIELTRGDGRIAAVWIPNAVAIAVMLRSRLRQEEAIIGAMWVGNALANFASGDALFTAMGLATSNSIEIVIALLLVRQWCGERPDILDIGQLSRFLVAAALLAPMVSATFAVLILEANGPVSLANWGRWMVSDGLGMTIIAPSVMIAIDAWRSRRRPTREEATNWTVMLIGGTALTIAIFAQSEYPLLFLAGPIVVGHAFRLGALGTAISVIKIAVIASVFTSLGTGPVNLIEGSLSTKLIVLQAFLAAAFLIGLPVAAILSRRERIIQELNQGRRQLDLLARNVSDAILQYDRSGICTYASPSVRDVLSRSPEDFIGRMPSDKLHEDARERITAVEQGLVSGELQRERFTYRRLEDSEDGSPVFIEADCATIIDPATGERDGFMVSARDVTERVELELLLTRARKHAENAARAKSEFLANMSHEIRTPMNGVLGFAELMLQSDLDDEQRRHAEMIVQSGRSMMMLLNDVLDLSKIEAGQIRIDYAPVDLHATLAECAALHRPAAEKKGLELIFKRERKTESDGGEDDCAGWIRSDGLRIRQIVLNLIANAVKFTESGRVRVSYRIADHQLQIMVADTGIGIARSRVGKIFQPFTQAEGDTARRFGGTGLGLTISRQLAELLGGHLKVESEENKGSSFTLSLPAAPASPDRSAERPETSVSLEDLPNDARILLVEDHDINRILATEMLDRCGQDVALAHDGNEAITMVMDGKMRGRPYDLVLMDIQMPGCDGYTAARAIRAGGVSPDDLPIIALTANAFPEDVAAARDAGMQGHLAKPLVFADLARTLQRWLPTRIVETPPTAAPPSDTPAANSQPVERDRSDPAPIVHSSELIERWNERREEVLTAIRRALDSGLLDETNTDEGGREQLARIVHKLAGTAAMFEEPELGKLAGQLDHALRSTGSCPSVDALARKVLAQAEQRALSATG